MNDPNNYKNGVDWFPLETVLDTKFELLEAQFGIKGFAVIVKLFQKIYGGQGYYCEFTYEIALLFARNIGVNYNVVSDIISAAIKRGIFDQDMYEKHQILTSRGIQKRYFKAAKRRVCIEVVEEYLLVKVNQKTENVNKKRLSVCKNAENVCRNEQRRGEEKRVEESRVEESAALAAVATAYEENIGFLTPIIHDVLLEWLKKVDASLITYAIEQAVTYGKRNWSYIEKIINNHYTSGRRTRAEAEAVGKPVQKPATKQTAFNNFAGRDNNGDALQQKILKKRMEAMKNEQC